MNCYVCEDRPSFASICIIPNVFICDEHMSDHLSEQGNHVFRIWKTADLFPILLKDLKMIKNQIRVNFDLEMSKKLNQMNKSVQEFNDDFKS